MKFPDLTNIPNWIQKAWLIVEGSKDPGFWCGLYAHHVKKLHEENTFLSNRNLHLEQQVSELIRKLHDLADERSTANSVCAEEPTPGDPAD